MHKLTFKPSRLSLAYPSKKDEKPSDGGFFYLGLTFFIFSVKLSSWNTFGKEDKMGIPNLNWSPDEQCDDCRCRGISVKIQNSPKKQPIKLCGRCYNKRRQAGKC